MITNTDDDWIGFVVDELWFSNEIERVSSNHQEMLETESSPNVVLDENLQVMHQIKVQDSINYTFQENFQNENPHRSTGILPNQLVQEYFNVMAREGE